MFGTVLTRFVPFRLHRKTSVDRAMSTEAARHVFQPMQLTVFTTLVKSTDRNLFNSLLVALIAASLSVIWCFRPLLSFNFGSWLIVS